MSKVHLKINLRMVLGIASVLSFIAFLFSVEAAGVLAPPVAKALKLVPVTGKLALGAGFRIDGTYTNSDRTNVPANIAVYGSWIGSDASTGTAMTGWYSSVARFDLMVAGYPVSPNMSLTVETEGLSGAKQSYPITVAVNPGEVWTEIGVPVPNAESVKQFRIVAVDNSKALRGWLGFSDPFVNDPGDSLPTLGKVGVAAMRASAILSFITGVLCGLAALNKRWFPSQV